MLKNVLAMMTAVGIAASVSFAQPPEPRHPMPPQDMPPHEAFIKKLNLTEAQQTQMQKLRIDLMKKQTQLHSKVQTLRLDTKELFLADKVDRSAIEKNIKGISDAQEQMKLNMLDHWFAVNAILAPEQQKIWKNVPIELGEQMRAGMRERGRMMMRQHPGKDSDSD